MDSHATFVPGKKEIVVGELELVVVELGAAQRDAIVQMIGDKIQAVNVRQMLRGAKSALVEDDEKVEVESSDEKEADGGVSIMDIVTEVFSGMLTDADCIVLDNVENRNRLKKHSAELPVPPVAHELPLHDKYAVEHWKPLWSWVRANITTKQELELVRTVVNLNDFAGLGKNLMTLAGELIPGFGEGELSTTPVH